MSDENELIDNISKLYNECSRILYLIFYLKENNIINYEQKIALKHLVLKDYKIFTPLINELVETKNIELFTDTILKLINKDNENNIEKDIDEYLKNNNDKHLITISSKSWNDENTKDEIGNDI